ncbi:K+-transporting ATPase ATPase A chain [Thermosporothrix hazakensis]|uniref:Potassium-transporting ATPase potassium-binding subunit n=2 Tax=Thermosporothrix TaxID=768650 RepID=A0A326U9U6_THEHA|nr:potassium-transporting ATPase subunit KdpA [Thermosporothrix hazakensis]PZW31963.1 K+-transporting ATPase ATPase A chain [Thermosporothrix hazakensis]BBH91566.1 potassium-transporting ATPase potassium-binding subunit [Thermosporothrix sp. COM3]GCE49712.1 potassium-transporting ATPase potassium-binding subunit [Thermosporothrix hazakensis]
MPVMVNSILQVLVFLVILLLLTKPLGLYMYYVFNGQKTWLTPVLRPVENLIYRICGVKADEEQKWTGYTVSMLAFSLASMLFLYLLQRIQGWLPLNPQGFGAVEPNLAFNTAASFTTNTNWQAYGGEQTMSYLTQMAGLAFQNFVSAAAGIAIAVALIRGLSRKSAQALGNFWVDLTRITLYILIPICIVGALVLVSQGVVQNFQPYVEVTSLEGVKQVIAQGPVASQEIIKELGTNGGGFFNANSAHPFENPNVLTNMIEMLAILVIPAALVYTFGRSVGNTKQGWAIWAAMALLFVIGIAVAMSAEQAGNPLLTKAGANLSVTDLQAGGNMEGKEVRFGITQSALFAVVTTVASCGAVNGFHDSYTPLGGMIPMANIALGEVIFGGVGSGLYGMLLFAIIAVFIAGLMVGRTPEYLGKKIEKKEMKMAALAILVMPATILIMSAVAAVLPIGTSSIANPGPHGLSEILYAYTSGAGNNGSAFGGLAVNTPFYNWTIGFAMLLGRFLIIVPTMAIAGSMVKKKVVPAGPGTFPTTGPLFVFLLAGTVVIVGALTYFPAYSLGPIVEHLLMLSGKVF